jgi:hypothetical protein
LYKELLDLIEAKA